MSAREDILSAVRKNRPPAAPLPDLPDFPPPDGADLLWDFERQLARMGGRSFRVADGEAARAKVAELFPAARVVCSTVPELPGTRAIDEATDPRALADVDVGIVQSPLAVAETGAVFLTERDLTVNALGVLSEHLVVLLPIGALVRDMHDAYRRIDFAGVGYGLFMAGPSATGDIEGVLLHGAQGARTLTVLLTAGAQE